MEAVQMFSTTPYSPETVSLKQLRRWEQWMAFPFQGPRNGRGASDCLGPALGSSSRWPPPMTNDDEHVSEGTQTLTCTYVPFVIQFLSPWFSCLGEYNSVLNVLVIKCHFDYCPLDYFKRVEKSLRPFGNPVRFKSKKSNCPHSWQRDHLHQWIWTRKAKWYPVKSSTVVIRQSEFESRLPYWFAVYYLAFLPKFKFPEDGYCFVSFCILSAETSADIMAVK